RTRLHLHPFPTRRSSDLPPGPKGMTVRVPTVKIADDTYSTSVRGPHGKVGTRFSRLRPNGMSTEDSIETGMGALVEPVQIVIGRSEEHTSELQSRENLVC